MTESERLIEILKEKQNYGVMVIESQMDDRFNRHKQIDNISIANHLLDNGVIVPPCKVGDTVYGITVKGIREIKIESINCWCSGIWKCNCWSGKGKYAVAYKFSFDDFDKTVFLTREEAEKALKEVQE